jgi:hypothetical protein
MGVSCELRQQLLNYALCGSFVLNWPANESRLFLFVTNHRREICSKVSPSKKKWVEGQKRFKILMLERRQRKRFKSEPNSEIGDAGVRH